MHKTQCIYYDYVAFFRILIKLRYLNFIKKPLRDFLTNNHIIQTYIILQVLFDIFWYGSAKDAVSHFVVECVTGKYDNYSNFALKKCS